MLLLKKKYPEPQKLVTDVFKPISETERLKPPDFYMDRSFGNNIYKGRLELKWPHTIKVTSSQITEERATESVYLLACELLTQMGFIQIVEGQSVPMKPSTILQYLKKFASITQSGSTKDLFQNVNTLESQEDEEQMWRSVLCLHWPVDFTVSAKAHEMPVAFHEMCLLTAMKLKRLGLLDSNNNLSQNLVYRVKCNRKEPYMLDDLHPDAEIYVDASKHGLGAYLLTSEDDTIRWISDRWTNKTYFDPIKYTTIAEFYALVTAIYTWKHKFLGKKVLCYSDCLSAVHLVNNGLYVVRNNRTNRRIDPRNEKLFKTLINTCEKYDITLFARHVNRVNNVPADLLSRSDVKSFQEIVPTAFHIPKKSKKLDFCKPKDDDYLNPEDRKRK